MPFEVAWPGALVGAILFSLGKQAFGSYLGGSAVSSAYGAAGSLVLLLIWVYYSVQTLLFGTEVSRVIFRHREALALDRLRTQAQNNERGVAA